MASKRLSKLGVQFHFICRHTALTSIQSSNYLPNSKPCCGRSLHIPSRTPLSPSTACARPSPLVSATSLGLSVQHSSPTQDMVNLTGKRSSVRIEQLVAVDLVVADVLLPFRRDQILDELLTELFLDVWMLLRVHQHDAILIEH